MYTIYKKNHASEKAAVNTQDDQRRTVHRSRCSVPAFSSYQSPLNVDPSNVAHFDEPSKDKGELEKLSSMEDRGQTDRITTPTRAGFRRCGWPWQRHTARLAALTGS